MLYKADWAGTQRKWQAYWKRDNPGRPLMHVVARLEERMDPARAEALRSKDMEDKYLRADRIVARYRYYCETSLFLAESFPNLSVDFGPGSMAAYLGCEVEFQPGTVWFEPFVQDWADLPPLRFDADAKWFQRHIQLFAQVRTLAGDDFYVAIPDIIENLDILASMRGAQDLIFDMVDEPEAVSARVQQVTDLYFDYYDRFYALAKDGDGASCYTTFQIWGPGRTAKLQCDFSAMISPDQFRLFVQDSLRQQTEKLDSVLYHLDGPDAIRHLDAVMEIDGIDALQWTSGDYAPDGAHVQWYPIYDKAVAAGKGLWVKVYGGPIAEQIARVDDLVRRYGSNALFLYFSPMPLAEAELLMAHAEAHWKDVEGNWRKG